MTTTLKLIEIPEDIGTFLFLDEAFDIYSKIKEAFSLDAQADVFLVNVIIRLLKQDLPLSNLPQALQAEFPNLSPESSQKLAVELLSGLFLEKPIKGFLPGVEEQIVAWGGVLPELTLDEKTEEVARKFDGKLSTDAERSRLRFLLKGFLADERTEEGLLSFLGKAERVGGLTVAPELALEIVSEAKKIMTAKQSGPSESIEVTEEVVEPESLEVVEELVESKNQ